MKLLKQYINEWTLNNKSKVQKKEVYKQCPMDDTELINIIIERLRENTTSPDLDDIDTSNITDMSNLFDWQDPEYINAKVSPNEIEVIDIMSWDLSNVENIEAMFINCEKLKIIFFPTDHRTSKLKQAHDVFCGCKKLNSIKNIECLDTSNVKSLRNMFKECKSLSYLNLSKFDIKNVEDISYMFYDCTNLHKIKVNREMKIMDKLKSSSRTTAECVFTNCPASLSL